MAIVHKIHPSIGVARVGDSEELYLAPETAGGLPLMADGRPFTSRDFRDAQGRLRRQAARFRVYRYDDAHPDGVEVVAGVGGVKSIRWQVHLANKKATWYQFLTLLGEGGYTPDHPLRNADVTNPDERRALMIDPGPRQLTGPGQRARFARDDDPAGYPMIWPPEHLQPETIDVLGEMQTDADGRLIVAGGHGRSGSNRSPAITHFANNDGWWDDTSDGPVDAHVVYDDGREERVELPAWVIVGPPGYAPEVMNLVTMWDTMYDVAVRRLGLRPDIYRDSFWQESYHPHFEREIAPILRRGMGYPWVSAIPPHAHRFDMEKLGDPHPSFNSIRQYILQVLRPPMGADLFIGPLAGQLDQVNAAPGLTMMPYLAGDNAFLFGAQTSKFLKLTDTQYFLMQQWARGLFHRKGPPRADKPGEALDRASLEGCVGGAFSPGIEMPWIVRNPAFYMEPFRIKHRKATPTPLSLGTDLDLGLEPGDACKYMAVPWQADFNECAAQPVHVQMGRSSDSVVTRIVWWWPAQRPSAVWRRDEGAHHGRRQVAWVGSLEDQNARDYVQYADDLEMVSKWKYLGFVYNVGTAAKPEFLEVERRPEADEEG
jgi:hypothetical protein